MTSEQIKKKILKYHWEPWLKRPFYAFIMSTFCGGNTKGAFKKIGLAGWEYNTLLSDGVWYQHEKLFEHATPAVAEWLKHHSVKEITSQLDTSFVGWKKEVVELGKNPKQDTLKKLKRIDAILREITTYVWATHVAEHVFLAQLKKQAAKFIKGDVDKFIGDASYPSKLNEAEKMVEEFKNGISAKILAKKYGWMRARDGFARPYTAKEITEIAEHALSQAKHKHPIIPRPLEKMFSEARELVFLRTQRSDCYFEILYVAKPILKTITKKFKIPFKQLKYYTTDSLMKGTPKYYSPHFACAAVWEKCYYFNEPLFGKTSSDGITELKGNIAQMGKARGRAKIVMSVKDLPKVKKGDILITYMTSPNFLPAMKLASAFVTDEGGLTCHAAIVAREMGKPCIIGTKISTKVFKDGDLVEVDTNKGIVKKINL